MESVNKVLNEVGDTAKGQRALGALTARKDIKNRDWDGAGYKGSADISSYADKAWKGKPNADYHFGYNDYLSAQKVNPRRIDKLVSYFEKRLPQEVETLSNDPYYDDDNIETEAISNILQTEIRGDMCDEAEFVALCDRLERLGYDMSY